MNEALRALEKLGNIDVIYNRNGIKGCYSIKDTDEFEIIEKELKALEIIKDNLNIDEILLAIKRVCKASDYDLAKEVL